MYVALKFLHIAFFSVWFAGLLALPWIFGHHAASRSEVGIGPWERIERLVYFSVMTPAAVLAVIFGAWLMFYGFGGAWLHVKLTLITVAVIFHLYCGTVMLTFIQNRNHRGPLYFRVISQMPLLLLIPIVFLAAVKPI